MPAEKTRLERVRVTTGFGIRAVAIVTRKPLERDGLFSPPCPPGYHAHTGRETRICSERLHVFEPVEDPEHANGRITMIVDSNGYTDLDPTTIPFQ